MGEWQFPSSATLSRLRNALKKLPFETGFPTKKIGQNYFESGYIAKIKADINW
jgi:hypothetical protein